MRIFTVLIPRCWHVVWQDNDAWRATLLMGFIGAAFITGLFWAIRTVEPGVSLLESKVINSVVEEGGVLMFQVSADGRASRECFGQITREFTQRKDIVPEWPGSELVKWRQIAPPPINRKEGYELRYVVAVPLIVEGHMLEPGEWEFFGDTAYFCGGIFGTVKHYQTRVNKFTIVPKGTKP